MSPNKQRKVGQPACQLRLVPSPSAYPLPEPDPELKAALDDMRCRYMVQQEMIERGPDDRDAS